MSHLFISYSHKDSEYAHKLAKVLEENGFDIWIDNRIDYGAQWPLKIQEKLDSCTAFIVIMSQKSYESSWVQNELNRAQRKNKPVFPILLEGNEPWLSIEATQFYDARHRQLPPNDFYFQLHKIIGTSQLRSPTRTQNNTSKDVRIVSRETVLISGLSILYYLLTLANGENAIPQNLQTGIVAVSLYVMIGTGLGMIIQKYGVTRLSRWGTNLGILIGSAASFNQKQDSMVTISQLILNMFICGFVGWALGRYFSR